MSLAQDSKDFDNDRANQILKIQSKLLELYRLLHENNNGDFDLDYTVVNDIEQRIDDLEEELNKLLWTNQAMTKQLKL